MKCYRHGRLCRRVKGTKHDLRVGFQRKKNRTVCFCMRIWRYVDENQFEWRLAVEEDATAEKQVIKNRHTEEVEALYSAFQNVNHFKEC